MSYDPLHGATRINNNSESLGDVMRSPGGSSDININLLDADITGENAQKLIRKFEDNMSKNSNQIIDGIIDREARAHSNLYTEHKYDRQGLQKRTTAN